MKSDLGILKLLALDSICIAYQEDFAIMITEIKLALFRLFIK